jgi:hypothetical protein
MAASTMALTVSHIGWDTQSPYTLLLPQTQVQQQTRQQYTGDSSSSSSSSSGTNEQYQLVRIDSLLAQTGATRCTNVERVALSKLLQCHEEFQNSQKSVVDCIRVLMNYRMTLGECIVSTIEHSSKTTNDDNTTVDAMNNDVLVVEQLKSTYSILHLVGVFLPPIPDSQWLKDHLRMDVFEMPGGITADSIRCLRRNLLIPVQQLYPEMNQLLNMIQPEEYGQDSNMSGVSTFWGIIHTLVRRGCLEMAWDVLSCHSIFVSAMERHNRSMTRSNDIDEDDYPTKMLEEYRAIFLTIRDILLRAPIPGGRSEIDDGSIGLLSMLEYNKVDVDYQYFAEGLDVGRNDYRYWDKVSDGDGINNIPIFRAEAAVQQHHKWRRYVTSFRSWLRSRGRLLEIDSILGTLIGDFHGISFFDWSEHLCAELLYHQPQIKARYIGHRASKLMLDYGENMNSSHNRTILSIMDGNPLDAMISAMNVSGGFNGAALPSTMVSASSLCSLPEISRKFDFLTAIFIFFFL